MTIVQCHECRADISTSAGRCPQCGAPGVFYVDGRPVTRFHFLIAWVVCVGLMIGLMALHRNDVIPMAGLVAGGVVVFLLNVPLAKVAAKVQR